ncbi:MAG: hypothetical protein FWE42_09590, partial [Defluviitaleaceae bacterium]|nr:hypothetical protein [Defluviitaleaceae bacterium]
MTMFDKITKASKSQKIRIIALFVVLAVVAAVAVIAYDSYEEYAPYGGYEEYGGAYGIAAMEGDIGDAGDYSAYQEYDGGYGYDEYTPYQPEGGYIEGGQDGPPLPAYGNEYEEYDGFEGAGYEGIVPALGITVNFHGNPVTLAFGHTDRDTQACFTITPSLMPNDPTWPAALGLPLRTFIGWNTQNNGRGTWFDGNTVVDIVTGPFDVYAIWGFVVRFDGNGPELPGVHNNPIRNGSGITDFTPRLVPHGWAFNDPDLNHTAPGALPNRFMPDGVTLTHTFIRWTTDLQNSAANEFDPNTPITGPVLVSADWLSQGLFTVTFSGGANSALDSRPCTQNNLLSHNSWIREVIPGLSIYQSGRFPNTLNRGSAWPLSAPSVVCTQANPNFSPGFAPGLRTLEGWYASPTSHDAWPTTRWIGPGGNHTYGAVNPDAFLRGNEQLGNVHPAVTSNITVHAQWVYRVTFHPNGGSVTSGPAGFPVPGSDDQQRTNYRDVLPGLASGARNVNANGRVFNSVSGTHELRGMPNTDTLLPHAVTKPGFIFNGWWDRQIPEADSPTCPNNPLYAGATGVAAQAIAFAGSDTITGSRTVFAHWVRDGDAVVKVTFNLNGAGAHWFKGDAGINDGSLFRPAHPGDRVPALLYDPIMTAYPVPHSTMYATLNSRNPLLVLPPVGDPAGLRRNWNMPRHPERPGYVFMGWYIYCEDTNVITNERFFHNTPVPEDIYVYARWEPAIMVVFDANGGALNPAAGGSHDTTYRRPIPVGGNFNAMVRTAPPPLGPWQGHINTGSHFMNMYHWTVMTQRAVRITPGATPNFERLTDAEPWNTRADGTGTRVFANTPITQAMLDTYGVDVVGGGRELRLFAQWAAPVTFDANLTSIGGGFNTYTDLRMVPYNRSITTSAMHAHTAALTMPNITAFPGLVSGSTVDLPALALGRNFEGWHTCPNASSAGEWFTAATVVTSPITVYGIWKPRMYFSPNFAPHSTMDGHGFIHTPGVGPTPAPTWHLLFTPGDTFGDRLPDTDEPNSAPRPTWVHNADPSGHIFLGWYSG